MESVLKGINLAHFFIFSYAIWNREYTFFYYLLNFDRKVYNVNNDG